MQESLEIMKLAARMAQIGNQNSLSDAGVAVLQASAGLEGAAMNILINIPGITDQQVVADLNKQVASIRSEARELSEQVLTSVNTKLLTPSA
jgi:formiminotetrahydrofolate cyclodeaminase